MTRPFDLVTLAEGYLKTARTHFNENPPDMAIAEMATRVGLLAASIDQAKSLREIAGYLGSIPLLPIRVQPDATRIGPLPDGFAIDREVDA